METVALFVSALGHACWDNVLVWMVHKDQDASILHMHWLRMCIMCFFLCFVSRNSKRPSKSILWWLKFALLGWTVPGCLYTVSVLFTGYRFSFAFQPFIPLVVAFKIGAPFTQRRSCALSFAMLGSMSILSNFGTYELWMIWGAIMASIVHVYSISEWFVMLNSLENNQMGAISMGACIGVFLLFITMIVWTPEHLSAAYMSNPINWVLILTASAAIAGCKYWVLAVLSRNMSGDSVAIFECVHPIATLCSDIIRGNDVFEWQDAAAIFCFVISWILYPKSNIKST
jgi:hypothetical protein